MPEEENKKDSQQQSGEEDVKPDPNAKRFPKGVWLKEGVGSGKKFRPSDSKGEESDKNSDDD